ncbi:DUF3618 domain-containing protein [Propionimicrobium sp. PCR01-08-3]|uniref:DUF3618 domain-containing protein n=1 Tax=Propionimicrobium sp. PCR01-08-3 TaxID=3052086 RepID=UPI00255CF0DB|nr:DUF3618 domain-containing protein [Propionimicrobium sp. PCR01-08-3]WIY83369.1 DUF3618 domain-containing protein [Propionimicrobium sp. PCR01-08-3]
MASNQRTPEQIRADIAASRHAMTVGIEGLISEVHPIAIKNRAEEEVKKTVKDTKQMIFDTVSDVRGYFVDEGGPRWNNIGTVALIAAGVAASVGAVSGVAALVRKAGK